MLHNFSLINRICSRWTRLKSKTSFLQLFLIMPKILQINRDKEVRLRFKIFSIPLGINKEIKVDMEEVEEVFKEAAVEEETIT